MMREVFNDAAARLVLEVLGMEQLAVASMRLDAHPLVEILIPDSRLYREYIQGLRTSSGDESLAVVHLTEALVGKPDDDSPVVLELVKNSSGCIDWVRRPL